MSNSPAIVYLRLDANNDPSFDQNAQLSDLAAVAQAIRTRLLLFEGEWWENLNLGTPMFQEIMSKRATPSGQEIMALAFVSRITGTPYVSGVEDVSINFDDVTRALTFRCTARTSFGNVPVDFMPGNSARLT